MSRVHSRLVCLIRPLVCHRRVRIGRLPLLGAMLVVGALVAGCGGSSAASHVTPTPQTAAYTCPAGHTSMAIPGKAVVMKGSDSQHDTTVHVGQVVVIELSPQLRWSFNPSVSQAHNLTPQQPTGALDSAVNVCFWQWQAQSTGTAQLRYFGQPNCQASQQNCPALTPAAGGTSGTPTTNIGSSGNPGAPTNPGPYQYVSQMQFTIHVS